MTLLLMLDTTPLCRGGLGTCTTLSGHLNTTQVSRAEVNSPSFWAAFGVRRTQDLEIRSG